jgi:hypothetical protein
MIVAFCNGDGFGVLVAVAVVVVVVCHRSYSSTPHRWFASARLNVTAVDRNPTVSCRMGKPSGGIWIGFRYTDTDAGPSSSFLSSLDVEEEDEEEEEEEEEVAETGFRLLLLRLLWPCSSNLDWMCSIVDDTYSLLPPPRLLTLMDGRSCLCL